MYCTKCGAINRNDSSRCTKCGNIFETNTLRPERTIKNTKKYKNGEKKIKTHLFWSILSAVFGSVSFGVAAIVFAGMTNAELGVGDLERAEAYSSKAGMFCIISWVIAFIKFACIFLLTTSSLTATLMSYFV